MAKFEIALLKAMAWEGHKSDDPVDPGGRTYKGVTQRSWDAFCKSWNQPNKDVWTLTDDEVFTFYRMDFWIPISGKLIKSQALADILFSMAILQGRRPAVRRLQEALLVPADGVMGPQTLAALDAEEPRLVMTLYKKANVEFFERLVKKRPASAKFLAGWKNRVESYGVNS